MSEASLMSGEPGLPAVSWDSDLDQLPGPDPEDHPGVVPAALSSGPRGLDTHQACSWPELRSLLQQLPPQDSDVPAKACVPLERYCLALGKEEQAELQLFHARRKQEALGQGVACLVPPQLEGYTCEKCRKQLKPGDYGVFAARAGERHCWHRPCFACQVCGQTLINLICFYHDGRLYCGRHHAELLRPRCPACDQLIFSRRCTEAEGRHWHENHFCCQDCAGPLCGGRYALPGGSPCCPSCFESRYSDAGSSRALEGLATLAAPPAPPSPPCPPPPPDASLRARSSHRASLAGALQGPPGPTPRRGRGCGAGLAPGRGTRPPSGEAGPGGSKRRDRTSLDALSSHGAASLAPSSSLEAQQGLLGSCPEKPQCRVGTEAEGPPKPGQDRLEMPRAPKEDAPCSTCSSSSDSEPEGFFFGQPLPRSRNAPGRPKARDNDTPRKHCTLS